MSNINKQSLREAAEKASTDNHTQDEWFHYLRCSTPETVLALLDELEAAEQVRENWRVSFENERIRADKLAAELNAEHELFLRAKALMYQSGGTPIENSLNPINAWLYDAERATGVRINGEG
ncbi:TPA: ead/Ea22-like family protein [Escherichia coli]|uniref:ead/Ea22-like family protein n=2 Tax=Escherichia coli TaxID=562 RepID=UPI0010E04205|nr:ead/Ea22-like family protein [Escherichia coli]BEA10529.1 hypothetical protein VEE26_10360 [Escherichia coli]GDS39380.1 hypothetical protein BvCmsSINP024_03906 [Escherichia coli]